MSCFVVSDEHLHALVTSAKMDRDFYLYHEGKDFRIDSKAQANLIGQALKAQNYRSYNTRYNDTDEKVPEYKFRESHDFSAVEIIKACKCYIYQACETEDYKSTLAIAFCEALINAQFHKLSGYEKADWEITKPKSNAISIMSMLDN